jgi:hypothetical protein
LAEMAVEKNGIEFNIEPFQILSFRLLLAW